MCARGDDDVSGTDSMNALPRDVLWRVRSQMVGATFDSEDEPVVVCTERRGSDQSGGGGQRVELGDGVVYPGRPRCCAAGLGALVEEHDL